jgi:phospholipid/cholesterol/gamma-HCH transport system permease protein
MAAGIPSKANPPGAGPGVEVLGGEVLCSGSWTVDRIHQVERRLAELAWPAGDEIVVDCAAVAALDTAGTWLLHATGLALERQGRHVALRLRPEHQALLEMIRSPALAAAEPAAGRAGLLPRLGRWALGALDQALAMVSFVGESAMAGARSLARPSRIRWRSVLHEVQVAGFDALPIVGLLSFLLGLVIAYQGAGPLARYGANTFVADLVGLAMLRELAPLLTAIVVAGRSGSAWAAQIGTMKVTEEIDALRTVGIAPLDLLVLPKVLALTVALPLLTVFADALGVAGGMAMSRSELGVSFEDFLDRFAQAVRLADYLVGVGKAPVFAAVIALVGCHQGFQVSGDAESVGRRTTVSVVQSIFAIIVVDALFSVVFSWLGI